MNATASSLTPDGIWHAHVIAPDSTVFASSAGPGEWHTHAPDPEKPGHSTEDCGHRHALPPELAAPPRQVESGAATTGTPTVVGDFHDF